MLVAYKVQKGVHKEKCDDSALIDELLVNDDCGFVEIGNKAQIMIADGVGGNAGGDEASRFILKAVKDLSCDGEDDLRKRLLTINDDLISYAAKIPGRELMATTISGILFDNGKCIMAHCGNTRIYSLQGSFLKQITEDQTTYQWLITTGNVDAADHCNKSEIRGAFGGGTNKFSNILVTKKIFERGIPRKILLTSDGVHDVLEIDEMEDIVADISRTDIEKVNMLVDSAVRKGSEDDCTAILIEI